ncbi:programmed cell death 1 ligand 2-like [Hemicordylus capensis]|uniref:programmed cell death 1 ligand 2-like n=1 Tax=Hemicordylus capensis TaxID=884348 RepID=UPI002304CBF8|nr:programmed cell death 1 ligand 2-like [Hemicordylus capensis]XP_053155965.1 programmed cell death 1 ligand 2-like [Hemicordylus capensis]
MPRTMFRLLPIVLLDIQLPLMTALFTVEVLQPRYDAEYGSDVEMGCRFPVDSPLNLTNISVLWKRKLAKTKEEREVYKFHNGHENLTFQDTDYRGRATLLRESLEMGRSVLSITNVKLTDEGDYLCAVYYGGADYKYITLKVKATYKTIDIQKRREDEDLIFTCQSEGYPLAEVTWHSEKNPNVSILANTTYELTKDGLFNITSTLRFKPSINESYSCVFWNKAFNEKTSAHSVFESSSSGKTHPISVILPICLLVCFLIAAVIIMVRRKSSLTNR